MTLSTTIFWVVLMILPCEVMGSLPVSDKALAAHWSPIIYQQVGSGNPKVDLMTKFDYDGDWNGANNWSSLEAVSQLKSYLYYSVVHTSTHAFVSYYIYHPRMIHPLGNDIENDMKMLTLVIHKNKRAEFQPYGEFQMLVLNDQRRVLRMSTNNPYLQSNVNQYLFPTYRGVKFDNSHVLIDVLARNHTLYEGSLHPTYTNEIRYYYGGFAETVSEVNYHGKSYSYDLIPIDELWDKRHLTGGGSRPFGAFGQFNASSAQGGLAPWAFNLHQSGYHWNGMNPGALFSDPVYVMDYFVDNWGYYSHVYTSHRYFTHQLDVVEAASYVNKDLFPYGHSDVYIRATANQHTIMDQTLWKFDNLPRWTYRAIRFGSDDAEGAARFEAPLSRRYLALPIFSLFQLAVFDRDDEGYLNQDDYMGQLSVRPYPGQRIQWYRQKTDTQEAGVTATIHAVR